MNTNKLLWLEWITTIMSMVACIGNLDAFLVSSRTFIITFTLVTSAISTLFQCVQLLLILHDNVRPEYLPSIHTRQPTPKGYPTPPLTV